MKTIFLFLLILSCSVSIAQSPDFSVPKKHIIPMIFNYPGYNITNDNKQRKMLFIERSTFLLDETTTYIAINKTPKIITLADGSNHTFPLQEGNPIMSIFGNRNTIGILGSGIFWDSVYNISTSELYKYSDHHYSNKTRKVIHAGIIIIGCYYTEEHIRAGLTNINNIKNY